MPSTRFGPSLKMALHSTGALCLPRTRQVREEPSITKPVRVSPHDNTTIHTCLLHCVLMQVMPVILLLQHCLCFCSSITKVWSVRRRLLVSHPFSNRTEAQTGVSGQDICIHSGWKWYTYTCYTVKKCVNTSVATGTFQKWGSTDVTNQWKNA